MGNRRLVIWNCLLCKGRKSKTEQVEDKTHRDSAEICRVFLVLLKVLPHAKGIPDKSGFIGYKFY